jgi:Glycogen debranching enzyme
MQQKNRNVERNELNVGRKQLEDERKAAPDQAGKDFEQERVHAPGSTGDLNELQYVVDTRPLQEMPFVLTEQASPRHVIKHGSHFLVLDQSGAIPKANTQGYGYYRYDTRHLNHWEILLNGTPLSMLSSDFTRGYEAELLYTNIHSEKCHQSSVTVQRKIVLTDALWESITLENFGAEGVEIELTIAFQSDFADMFEVRGLNRPARGQRMVPVAGTNGSIFLAYKGLDGMLLETLIEFKTIHPSKIDEGAATFKIFLPVRQPKALELCIATRWNRVTPRNIDGGMNFNHAKKIADENYQQWHKSFVAIDTDNDVFNKAIERNCRDLYTLRQPTPKGIGLAAGVPWYATLFGRDSAITALQVLPFAPELAKNCIDVLAAYQGTTTNIFRAERPGKILHEIRLGELARLHEIPHSPYYGTVDATQLWLILLCEYVDWTGALEYAKHLWPNVRSALTFLAQATKLGYITYKQESEVGLRNQGWKDSSDSIMHADGRLAQPPIALCEAQAYLYLAYVKIARLAKLIGDSKVSLRLYHRALQLKERFHRDFWMENEKFVALALDGDGEPTRVISSNPGHCLWSGILDEDKAHLVADRLMSPEICSGWGIRTLSSSTWAYNPISYHNGSIWPHDNGLIIEGLRRVGRVDDAQKLISAMFEAMQHQSDFRLPELFCGFDRTAAQSPIDYPVSCRPQAWAAGVVFQMLMTCINIQPDATNRRVRIVDPVLPKYLDYLELRNLRIGDAQIDLALHRGEGSSYCQVLRKQGNVRVVIEA